ncbi:MAG: hypothetical protein DMD84_25540 [Candidatus Rokuibacteriota bacterium]|nr:MAG: hypothetical protein DMD84_25540 [Candidatus Rokubacteria bacterium]
MKATLREVTYSETRAQVREAVRRFAVEYGPKYPEAWMTLEKDADVLLTFFDFPAEHWKHLRTSNMVEAPFATARTTCRSCAQIVPRETRAADRWRVGRTVPSIILSPA